MSNQTNNRLLPYIFMLPAMIIICFVIFIPFFSNIVISLTNWNGFTRDLTFIGMNNYIEIFTDKDALTALVNTLKFTVIIVILQNAIALMLALVLFKLKIAKNFFRAALFLPTVIATVAVAFIWSLILNPELGWINFLANKLGMVSLEHLNILGNPDIVLYAIALVNVWQWTGWSMVVYLAGLQSVPTEIYEASDIDGASGFKRFIRITVPMLAPAFTINIVLTTMGSLKIFDLPYVMTNGGPGNASESMGMYVNYNAFQMNRMGYGCAVSIILFLFVLTVSFIQTNYLRKSEEAIT